LVSGHFATLANGVRHFTRLAETDTDTTAPITHNDEGAKIKSPSTLDDFSGAIDEYYFFG
jgi:hypothetical protein